MNKSEQIRSLARQGLSVSEIAGRLGIRYQFAYNVCRKAELIAREASTKPQEPVLAKPLLSIDRIVAGGFMLAGNITLSHGILCLPALPKCPGVYGFAWNEQVQYIGVATRSLAQRLYGYCRPGSTQRTNQRMNALISGRLNNGDQIDIYYATPPDRSWNGFLISGPIGLESGLIEEFHFPLNLRGG